MDAKQLVAEALDARENAYAPYSGYAVGAALVTTKGTVFRGTNVENASYGLTICAERSAVTAMVTAGETDIAAIAVATEDGGSMCGACRQVVSEFGAKAKVFLASADGSFQATTADALLPGAFDGSKLRGK